MAADWYYAKGGQRHGPVTEEQLRQLADSGQIQSTDLVWRNGMAEWQKVGSIEGVFPPQPNEPDVPPPVTATAEWYYSKGGLQHGPVTEEQLRQLAGSGQIQSTDLVWRKGMAEWQQAGSIEGFFFPPQPNAPDVPPPVTPSEPPPLNQSTPFGPPAAAGRFEARTGSGGGRMAVLILTIIAGFFSLFVGGCTAAVGEGVAQLGEGISDLDSQYGSGEDSTRIRSEAEEIRTQGGQFAVLGLLQAILGVAGGVYGFQKYNSTSEFAIGGIRVKRLTVASLAILVAALMSIHNCFGFITAGVMNGVAGMIALMRARNLHS